MTVLINKTLLNYLKTLKVYTEMHTSVTNTFKQQKEIPNSDSL